MLWVLLILSLESSVLTETQEVSGMPVKGGKEECLVLCFNSLPLLKLAAVQMFGP